MIFEKKSREKEYIIRLPSYKEKLQRHQEKIESFRANLDKKRTFVDRVADEINETFGSITFFFWNAIFFVVWIVLNTNILPGVVAFDPYPFGLLTMVVSLEAIFLSVFVLISQNRQARIADLREELDLQINRIAEKEITKLIQMQAIVMKHLGIRVEGDEELENMMRNIDTLHIQKQLESEEKKTVSTILPLISQSQSKSIDGVLKKISRFFDTPIKSVF